MKKLILLIVFLIAFAFGYSQTYVLRPRIDAHLFNAQLPTYYLDTTSTAQVKNGQLSLTGRFLISDGTVGAPSVALASDLNTGLYTTGADILNISAGGKEGILIDGLLGGIEIIMRDTVYIDGVVNFAADAQADDDYEISLPGVSALATGLQVTFIANTANTAGATLEITEVGDLDAILKNHDVALVTGDIEAGQVVVCVWDGTNWQMTSQLAQ